MARLFVPQLQIRRVGEEKLAVQATAHAPNGCYSAGEVRVSTTSDLYIPDDPGDGGIGIPDPVPQTIEEPLLRLHVNHSEKTVCPQVVKPLRFRAEVDPVEKADEVHAVTLVDGREMGRASEPIPPKERIPREPHPLSTEDWTAFLNRQPGSSGAEPRLIVTGTVVLRHQGFEVDLIEATGQARSRLQEATSKPSVLLDLEIRELEGSHPQVIYRPTVRYETNDSDPADVEQVAVLEPSGTVTKIPVKEVQ